jgi:hypothetical protein
MGADPLSSWYDRKRAAIFTTAVDAPAYALATRVDRHDHVAEEM